MSQSIITQNDTVRFLTRAYFGEYVDPIQKAIEQAYLDFCRTLTNFSKHPNRDKIMYAAEYTLYKEIAQIAGSSFKNQDEFDRWHHTCCQKLIAIFSDFKLYHGQAQKWINMTLKYLFILEPSKAVANYPFYHIPIDNIIIRNLKKQKPPKLKVAWSRLDDYQTYLHFQHWFRTTFKGIPMDNEFKLWLK